MIVYNVIITLTILASAAICFENCVFNLKLKNKEFQFDLTRFTSFKSINFTKANTYYSVRIKLCRTQEQKINCDGIKTKICLIKNQKNEIDIGSKIKEVKLDIKNQLFMSLESHLPICQNIKKITTNITFICNKNDQEKIVYIPNADNCKYLFEWTSVAACPVDDLEARKVCQRQIPSSHYDLNLNLLRRTSSNYLVENHGRRFELNICGRLVDNNKCGGNITTICDITDVNKPTVYAVSHSYNSELLYDESTKILKLIQHERATRNKKGKRVELSFKCDENIPPEKVKPQFLIDEYSNLNVKNKQNVAHFEVATAAVCIPRMAFCEVFTTNSQYNLKQLHKRVGNWDVSNEKSGGTFYLNVCGYLNQYGLKIPNACTDGDKTSACYVDSLGRAIPIGSSQIGPYFTNNMLQMNYTGGANCKNSLKWSTVINLMCSHESQLIHNSTNELLCVHIFIWKTPNACAVLFKRKNKCTVTHPQFAGHVYNIDKLKNKSFEGKDLTDNTKFRFSICSPLEIPCNGNIESAACFSFEDSSINIGKFSEEIVFENGRIYLIMQGEKCSDLGPNSYTTIQFLCDYTDSIKSINLKKNLPECTFEFEIYTKYACTPPTKSVDCTVKDHLGNLYNFSSLTKYNNNYAIDVGTKQKIILNVCHSIVNNDINDANCQFTSGICLTDPEQLLASNRYKNLGDVPERPQIENNKIVINMKNGFYDSHSVSSKIEFICSSQTMSPVLKSQENNQYLIQWTTPLACSRIKKIRRDLPCKECDLTLSYSLNIYGNKYDIAVYPKGITPHTVKCSNEYENVIETSMIVILKVNKQCFQYSILHKYSGFFHELSKEAKSPVDTIKNEGVERVWFKFICGFEALMPAVSKKKNYIQVLTINPKFCDKKLECYVDKFDLTPIKKTYVINTKSANYYIYMCTQGVQGVSGLMEVNQKNYSLGYQTSFPKVNPIGLFEVMFNDGDECLELKKPIQTYSSKIYFECDDNVAEGYPEYLSNSGCLMEFKWKTSLVCSSKEVEFNKTTCTAVVKKGHGQDPTYNKYLKMRNLSKILTDKYKQCYSLWRDCSNISAHNKKHCTFVAPRKEEA
ncbi:cation-independent mannose-6-phosphate receptor-like isoform X2 [Adelges cooleyi]|uniref:cation-independent mannose-6-phosphate receptor-like isoform X2 n=1 Tax=Adelges cooleyi TaxID=133065 RepID=UPI00217F8699|nr:cation-independent mannose-6-phosphate receptor-like isoform X2 [Adelges cooleyi]